MAAETLPTALVPAATPDALPPYRDLIDLDGWSPRDLTALIARAAWFREALGDPKRRFDILRGQTMVTLFYENSTRTRVSFERAGGCSAPTSSASPPPPAASPKANRCATPSRRCRRSARRSSPCARRSPARPM